MTTIRLKVLPKFPANVEAGFGIEITKANGAYTVAVDPDVLPPNPSTGNVVFFQCDTSGATDVSGLLQAAINTLEAAKGGIIYLPAGFLLMDTGVDITKGGITIKGVGWEDYRGFHGELLTLEEQRPTQGTYVYQTTNATDSPFRIANTANHVAIRDMGFLQEQPADAPGWTPNVYDPCIWHTPTGTSGGTLVLDNLLFWGVYDGVRLGNATGNCGSTWGNNIAGYAFNAMWINENIVDVLRLSNFHFYGGFLIFQDNIQAYARQNATGILSYRCDNPMFTNGFCLGFQHGFLFDTGAAGASAITSKFKIIGCDLDGCIFGVKVVSNGTAGMIVGCTMNGFTYTTNAGAYGVYINVTSGRFIIDNLETVLTGQSGIAVLGSGAEVTATNITVRNYNQDGSGVPAVNVAAGNTIRLRNLITFDGNGGAATAGAGTFTPIPVSEGGVGVSSYTIGDIPYASSTSELSKLSAAASGNVLRANGIGVAPSYGKVTFGELSATANRLFVSDGSGNGAEGTLGTGLSLAGGVLSLSFGTGVAAFLATPSSANLAAAVTDETGSGSLVFSISPTFTTPNLGTPSALTLTNATGLPVASGISGLGTGVATFLATPSSANLAAALTDETGSGAAVFATSPTLVTPALGTPSSVTLTNATGLPVGSGVSGLGTGVATALAINVGSAGAPVTNGGALGTPSSGVATNLTGTAAGLTAGNVTTNANLTGDVTSVGNATTLATVASAGTTGSSTAIPVVTIDAKGRTTGITTAAVVAPAGTLSGSTLASGVTGSSLTDVSLGTLTANAVAAVGHLPGTPTNDDAAAGEVGEIISAVAPNQSATVTITIASPAVVSWTAHGLALGSPFVPTTSGALPTGLTAGTTYWVIPVDANSFRLATTAANAIAGTAINTSGSQSGTHTGSSLVPFASSSAASVAFLPLAPGDWDVSLSPQFLSPASTSIIGLAASLSATTNTMDYTLGKYGIVRYPSGGSVIGVAVVSVPTPGAIRVSVPSGSTVPYFMVQDASISVSSLSGYGAASARRAR